MPSLLTPAYGHATGPHPSRWLQHYREYGWVMLRGLVNPAFAAEMLRALGEAGDFGGHPAKNGVEPFRSFMFSQRMSSNAAKLVNRARLKGVDVPMRWRQDAIPPSGVTKPAGQAPSEEQPSELQHYDTDGVLLGSGFHCDSAEHGSDRAGELQCVASPPHSHHSAAA